LLTNLVKSTPLFIVPFAPNTSFLGRDNIITALDQLFDNKNEDSPATIRKAALCGLGGIG
jgi:hypothetical protein